MFKFQFCWWKKCGFIGSVDVFTPYDLLIVTAAMLDDWEESSDKMWIVDIDTKDDSGKHWFRGEDLLKILQWQMPSDGKNSRP